MYDSYNNFKLRQPIHIHPSTHRLAIISISIHPPTGVTNIEELLDKISDKGMVLFSEEPVIKKTHVVSARILKVRQEKLKLNVQQLLDHNGGSIPLVDFEASYEYKFKEKLDYHFFGLEDFDTLCSVLNLVLEAAYSGKLVIRAGKIKKFRYMSTKSPDVYQQIEEILATYCVGISKSSLSCLETRYQKDFGRSLDYNSLGVTNIEELLDKMRDKGMVVFSEKPEIKETRVVCARIVKVRQDRLKLDVRQLLYDRGGSIRLIDFEYSYEYKFKKKLDYRFFGLKDLDHLCSVLNLVVEAGMIKINLRNMSTKDVYPEIQKILGSCTYGISTSTCSLSTLERKCEYEFKRPLNYNSLGVTDIKELLHKMSDKGMVLFYKKPESNITYVMCARTLKSSQKKLNLRVQELLHEHGGKIPLIEFENSYRNKFEVQLDYHYYGLKDFDSLCKVLNLVVEANFQGEEVVKKADKINLRKRKK